MALEFAGISIEGFRSFVDDKALIVPEEPGVFLITGERADKPEEANGVGKSSFMDAIVWSLYGKTSRGLKGKQIINWRGTNMTAVTLDLYVRDELVNVTRRQSPNSLTLQYSQAEPKVVEQHVIDSLLGITYSQFLASVMFAQFGEHFMDIGSTKQLEALSAVLRLSVWDERKKKAEGARLSASRELLTVETKLERAKARRDEKREQHEQVSAEAEGWDVQAAVRKHKRQQDQLIRQTSVELTSIQDQLQSSSREEQDTSRAVAFQKSRIADLGKSDCGYCGQKLSKNKIDELMGQKSEAVQSLKLLEVEQERWRKRVASLDRKNIQMEKLFDRVQSFSGDDAEIAEKLKSIEIEVETNPYEVQLQRLEDGFDDVTHQIKELSRQRVRISKKLELAKYWVKEFPKIKLWLLDRASVEMSALVNNALPQLGLDDWSVTCSSTKVLETGEERAKFDMRIRSPESPDWVRWEVWAGGETTKLRIAGDAAFADLTASRMSQPPAFEFWDEPTQHLSEKGCTELMEFFKHRSRTRDKQVWVIDHRTQYSGDVDHHWHFIRDEMGTNIHKR
jgi:hypothetical protein